MDSSHIISIVLLVVFCGFCHGKYTVGEVDEDSSTMIFLDKFCFDVGRGTLNFTFTVDSASENVKWVLYNDTTWNTVYDNDDMSCKSKIDVGAAGNVVSGVPKMEQFSSSVRPYYWYMVLSNCDATPVTLQYELLWLQGEGGWNQEFSYDEQGLGFIYLLFSLVFFLLFCVHIYGDFQLLKVFFIFYPQIDSPVTGKIIPSNNADHLFVFSLGIFLPSPMVGSLSHLFWEWNGFGCQNVSHLTLSTGAPFLAVVGEILDLFSTILFIIVLVLVAKGWGITYPTTSHLQDQKLILLILLLAYIVCFVVNLIWEHFFVNPASNNYLYESIPGYIYLILRFVTQLYFIWSLLKTVYDDSDSFKKKFYIAFGVSYSVWFLGLPVVVVLSWLIAAWAREKVVMFFFLFFKTLAFALICFLLWPKQAAKYFQVAVPDLFQTGSPYEKL